MQDCGTEVCWYWTPNGCGRPVAAYWACVLGPRERCKRRPKQSMQATAEVSWETDTKSSAAAPDRRRYATGGDMKDFTLNQLMYGGSDPFADTDTVENRVNNSTDFAIIDAAARAWIEAGGDADGVEFCWHHIRDRVGELA